MKDKARITSTLECRNFGKYQERAFKGRVEIGGGLGKFVRGRGGRGQGQEKYFIRWVGRWEGRGKCFRGRVGNRGEKTVGTLEKEGNTQT